MEVSSSNWQEQMQNLSAKHWAKLRESCRSSFCRTCRSQRVNYTKRKPTESSNQGLLGFTETKATTKDPVWFWPRSSAYILWLYSLVFLWDSQQQEQGLSLTLFLPLVPFSPTGFPWATLMWCYVPCLIVACYTAFGWCPWVACYFLRGGGVDLGER